jgi:hypothetical protein
MVYDKVLQMYVQLQGQGQVVKNLVPIERSCHKEYIYEI